MKETNENPIFYTTKITDINASLQGINESSNLTFRYTDIGDEVVYEIRGRGKNKFAKVASITRANEYNPLCKHFADCGGCSGQHINYEKQFEIKTKNIIEKYKSIHQVNLNLSPAAMHFHYRNRMDFAVFPGFIGLRQAENFRRIIDIKKCELQSPWANDELTLLRNLILNEFPNLPFNRKTGEGFLKYITIRTNESENDLLSIFTFIEEFKDSEIEDKFKKEIIKISSAISIVFCYNRKLSEVSADGEHSIVKGKSFFTEEINNKKIQVPFNSFFQPNPSGFIPIIRFIEKILMEIEYSVLIDLFCGTGFFSILFGDKFKKIIGFDWVESSIQTATENLQRLFPEKEIVFAKKDLLQFKDVFVNSNAQFTDAILILDPPRNGIGIKLSEYILESEIENIIYVSCNPYSQLDDLKILTQKYKIISGLLTDPYPHTPHLESVLYLKRLKMEPVQV